VDPLSVYLEDKFVMKLTEVLDTFKMPAALDEGHHHHERLVSKGPSPPQSVLLASSGMASRLCLDEIVVDPVEVCLSVRASLRLQLGLEQSPLNFAAFKRSNLTTHSFCLGQTLARHYISGALFRAGWVVGSLDLIGSPSGLTKSVGDGLWDFVALPYQGIMQVRIMLDNVSR